MIKNSLSYGNNFLKGLLLDLELGRPDTSRFEELKGQIVGGLDLRASDGSAIQIELDHVHFSQTTLLQEKLDCRDFVILSPQGYPWGAYRGPIEVQLDIASELVRKNVEGTGIPTLGICGGHQFLAMIFGAEVDFIDPAFAGAVTQFYPQEALAERGVVTLQTLRPDRIYAGLPQHPSTFDVVESHTEEVKNIPHPFVNLATSALSEIQLITIPGAIVYGMAFHPERGWGEGAKADQKALAGKTLLQNFFTLVHLRNSVNS